jgi:hypothetical protein
VHQDKHEGFVLKLDCEKAYNKVLEILEKRDFGKRWIDWIKRIMYRGSVGVTVNNMEGEFFQTLKGLRQGDPLSQSCLIWL